MVSRGESAAIISNGSGFHSPIGRPGGAEPPRRVHLCGRFEGRGMLIGRTILVAEDEPLIRLELTAALVDVGATVWPVADAREAFRLAAAPDLTSAVLDYNLGANNCNSCSVTRHTAREHPTEAKVHYPFHPRFGEAVREARSASISARSNCKNASENVGDSCIVYRAAD